MSEPSINLNHNTLLTNLSSMISGTLTTLILTLIDIVTVSNTFLPKKDVFLTDNLCSNIPKESDIYKCDYRSLSSLIFLLSIIFGIISHNLITKIKKGGIFFVIGENILFTKLIACNIVSEVYKKYKHLENQREGNCTKLSSLVIINLMACFMISTLLFSLFSFLISISGIGYVFEYIPVPVINGLMGGIGFSQFIAFLENIEINDYERKHIKCFSFYNKNLPIQMFIYGMLIGFLIYFISEKFPDFRYTILSTLVGCTSITYLITYFMSKNEVTETLIENKMIKGTFEGSFFNFFDFLKIITNFKNLDFQIIFSSKMGILNMAFVSLIHLPINYGICKQAACENLSEEESKKEFSSLSRELKTQSYVNFICSFTSFLPSYLVASYSIAYYNGGGESRFVGIIAGFFTTIIPLISPFFGAYLPFFVSGAVPLYISICFFYDFLSDIIKYLKNFTKKECLIKKSEIDYKNLKEENFEKLENLSKKFNYCDTFDFLISLIVAFCFVLLKDYSCLSVPIGILCCFLKLIVVFFFFKIKMENNYKGKVIYKNKTYDLYKPNTVNFLNLYVFDFSENKVIFDLSDVKYIDITAIRKLGDALIVI